ncbi:hypothetical protein DVH24_042840 [Malus domestica]|uniref:Uncharacterized protein n=3 Tax=Amygdaloideae TaxID=171637 RepID=A0A498KSB3_MALDO|nr:hypothetical protein DVH24_042840 [Malus domestica]
MLKMGKCKGCGKLGRMMPRGGSVSAYQFSLLLSPVVSVWDCIVRKMRYSYRPEWVYMDCNKLQPVVRKVKKKQVKDELDRQKQAEKKKRRLEKALATSAAIISELEKKKQKKKEEQQRLDEEGAAIAEAVALRVLLGEEDSDETWNSEWSLSSGPYERDYPESFCDDGGWGSAGFAAGLIAAQAVSSLRIAEDAHEGTIVLDGMLRR